MYARNRHLHISLFLKVGCKWLILRPLQCMFICSCLYLNRFGWDGVGEERTRDMRYSTKIAAIHNPHTTQKITDRKQVVCRVVDHNYILLFIMVSCMIKNDVTLNKVISP